MTLSASWYQSNRSWRSRSFNCCIPMGRCVQYSPGALFTQISCLHLSFCIHKLMRKYSKNCSLMALGKDIGRNHSPWKSSKHERAWRSQEQSSLLGRIGTLLKVKTKTSKLFSSVWSWVMCSSYHVVCAVLYSTKEGERKQQSIWEEWWRMILPSVNCWNNAKKIIIPFPLLLHLILSTKLHNLFFSSIGFFLVSSILYWFSLGVAPFFG